MEKSRPVGLFEKVDFVDVDVGSSNGAAVGGIAAAKIGDAVNAASNASSIAAVIVSGVFCSPAALNAFTTAAFATAVGCAAIATLNASFTVATAFATAALATAAFATAAFFFTHVGVDFGVCVLDIDSAMSSIAIPSLNTA